MAVFIVLWGIAVAGCATTPYQRVEEKRMNMGLSKAEEFYNLGMYASAALSFEKVIQLAVVEQDPVVMTRAQFRYALSLERCFADSELVNNAWDSAKDYAQTYGIQMFDILLGWLNWQISYKESPDIHDVDQTLARFNREYPPENLIQKIQWLNLSAKWHMTAGFAGKAENDLNDAMAVIESEMSRKYESKELAMALSLTLFNRAMVLVSQHQFNNALTLFSRSLALDSKNNNISGVYANLCAQAELLDVMGETGRAQSIRAQLIRMRRYMTSLSP